MRALATLSVLLLLAAVLPGPAAAGEPTFHPTTHTLRGPVDIRGDGDLTAGGAPNVAAGVVAGSGTPGDPFVIGGWEVVQDAYHEVTTLGGLSSDAVYHLTPLPKPPDCGISVRDTTAHVLIVGNLVHTEERPTPPDVPYVPEPHLPIPWGASNGICVTHASNVTVLGNEVWRTGTGIAADATHLGARNVVVEDNLVHQVVRGIVLAGQLEHVNVTRNEVHDVRDVAIHARLDEGPARIDRNHLHDVDGEGIVLTSSTPFQVVDNRLEDLRVGIRLAWVQDGLLEGNVIAGASEVAILDDEEYAKDRNADGSWDGNVTLRLRGNSVGDTPVGLELGHDSHANARENWWGESDGPGGEGAGNGTAIVHRTVDANTTYDPWLASEPAPPITGPITSPGCSPMDLCVRFDLS